MVQQRVYDYGALLTQARTKTFASRLFSPGVYENMDPVIIAAPYMELTAGSFLLPNGVLVVESANVAITAPIVAGDYTLTADHEDIQAVGGSPVIYTWRAGILDRYSDPNPNSLALLWFRYPGGPIDIGMFSVPPDVRTGEAVASIEAIAGWLQAPFPGTSAVLKGPNITAVGDSFGALYQHIGVLITNSAGVGTQTYQFRLPLPSIPRPRSIELYASIPALASVSLSSLPNTGGPSATYLAYAQDGSSIGATPTIVNGPVTALDATPAQVFTLANSLTPPATIGVTVAVPALSSGVFIKGFRLIPD